LILLFNRFTYKDNCCVSKASQIILGIDPGTVVMGYGLIEITNRKPVLLEMGVLHLSRKKEQAERLQMIFEKVTSLIQHFKPEQLAIEAPFFGKNVQSMLKLGRAQGVAIAAAMGGGLQVTEYSPKKIKQSITGNGNASKEQVFKLLQHQLGFKETPEFLDATDALAVALCHHFQLCSPLPGAANMKDWSEFIARNPGRIR